MSERTFTQPKKTVAQSFTPVQHGRLLQRKCACGSSPGIDGECADCRSKRLNLQHHSMNQTELPTLSNRVHDFSQVQVHVNEQAAEPLLSVNTLVSGIGRGHRQHTWFDPRIDWRLPDYTPAWTENGEIHLSVPSLFISPFERQKILQHEAIHSLHQHLAPQSETTAAHMHAEQLAAQGENNIGKLHATDFLHPVPALLAYPPQKYSPWTQVWIGNGGLVGEVEEAGVKVRIFKPFADINQTGPQSYVCGKHDRPPIPDLTNKMRNTARKTAALNANIPETAIRQRVALVVILANIPSKYAEANNQGLIMLKEEDFERGLDTVAHEGAHAVFEYHLRGSDKQKPDTFALRIADLFKRLSQTKFVPIPTRKFDPKHPPEKAPGQVPSGLVMVQDVLWSGVKGSGHSSEDADEFFASAYAGFLQQPQLLRQSINFYQSIDPTIKPLTEELFSLLALVANTKDQEKLAVPAKPEIAQEELKRVKPPTQETADFSRLGFLIEPGSMPTPDSVLCTKPTLPSKKSSKDPFEDIP